MIATQTIAPSKRLKIKFSGKLLENHPASRSCDFGKLVGHKLSFTSNDKLKVDDTFSYSLNTFSHGQSVASTCCKSKSSISLSDKRKATEVIESSRGKKQKLDRRTTQQCSLILKTLMTHPSGWGFNRPVDPVALGIPDYFSIITDPMDLGTVESKLRKNIYHESEEFAADIRLTFSNAMLYNPSDNAFHQMAKELNEIFEKRWKLLKENWVSGRSNFQRVKLPSGPAGKKPSRVPLSQNILLDTRSMISEEKVIKPSLSGNSAEVDCAKTPKPCAQKPPRKNFHKGEAGNRHACSSLGKDKRTLRQGGSKCIKCRSIPCQCSTSSDPSRTSSDLPDERSFMIENRDVGNSCRLDCQAMSSSASQKSKSGSDSDGVVSTLEDERKSPCGQSLTSVANVNSKEHSTPIFDVHLSPKKALRAAMLKTRFAETILKAQQKTLLDHCDKVDLVKMQQEKERLERRQQEERARIEAQIKAADMASQMKETEKQQQRQRDREAARIALHKMKRTVELYQNLEIQKELEELSGGVLYVHHRGCGLAMASRSSDEATPLERLGLYLKDEYLEYEDEESNQYGHGEEGEIFS